MLFGEWHQFAITWVNVQSKVFVLLNALKEEPTAAYSKTLCKYVPNKEYHYVNFTWKLCQSQEEEEGDKITCEEC